MQITELIEKHKGKKDLHITRSKCALVVVSEGKVIELEDRNTLKYCPLYEMVCKASPKEHIEKKIEKFGYFTPRREIMRKDIAVPFGTSEMMMYALTKGEIDCAVTVCDGVGTVVTDNPKIVQGIGARMNGLFYTTPIKEVQDKLREYGCIFFDDARINQIKGLEEAISLGYKKIAVTVNAFYGENFSRIRDIEKQLGVSVTVAGICSTGVDEARAKEVVRYSDLAWGCSSKYMRQHSSNAIVQITKGIPIFVYTKKGLEFVSSYSDREGSEIIRNLNNKKHYLLSAAAGNTKMLFGTGKLALAEAELPVAGRREPVPLT